MKNINFFNSRSTSGAQKESEAKEEKRQYLYAR